MKLPPEAVLYIRSMGKALRVTGIFTTDAATNAHLERYPDEGVIAEFKPYIFVANCYDKGVKIQD